MERHRYLYILSLRHYAFLWSYKRTIFMGDLPFWNYSGIPGAVDMPKLLKLVNYEDVISPLAEIFDNLVFSVSKLTPCFHRWAVFTCIFRLHGTVGYVWSRCILKKMLQSSSLNNCILFLCKQHKHWQRALAAMLIGRFPSSPHIPRSL